MLNCPAEAVNDIPSLTDAEAMPEAVAQVILPPG